MNSIIIITNLIIMSTTIITTITTTYHYSYHYQRPLDGDRVATGKGADYIICICIYMCVYIYIYIYMYIFGCHLLLLKALCLYLGESIV